MAVPASQPSTPIRNQQDELTCPTAPTRPQYTDAQRVSSPLPPSASNFLDQNNFPTLQSPPFISNNQRPHTFPSHFPQPHFFQPPPQFYSQPQPYGHQYFSQPQPYFYPHVFPSHNQNNVPFVPTALVPTPSPSVPSVSSTAPKALPSVSHIPLLSGRSDFSAWNNGVRSLILYLGHAGHIASPPATGIIPRPDRVPSYPPTLSSVPSATELATSRSWWEDDNIVSHILTSRLTAPVLSILPFDDDDESIEPRTSRTIYDLLRQLYSVHDHTSSSALYSELCTLQCGGRVMDYVTKWRAGITQLRAAKFVVSFRIVIERFLDRLPTSVPYDILRFRTMETINSVPVDDVAAFIKLTDEVLKIDNTYRRTSHTRPSSTRSSNPVSRTPSTVHTSSNPAPPRSSSQPLPPRSSLVCSNTNCGATGHTIDTCFKVGGGLEGKREQYLAS